jgi:hypothetical protein
VKPYNIAGVNAGFTPGTFFSFLLNQQHAAFTKILDSTQPCFSDMGMYKRIQARFISLCGSLVHSTHVQYSFATLTLKLISKDINRLPRMCSPIGFGCSERQEKVTEWFQLGQDGSCKQP